MKSTTVHLHSMKSAKERREFLEKERQVSLHTIGLSAINEQIAGTKNCENMIGATQIPLGVAGPLKIIRNSSITTVYVPLATTEGALVASVNRGCKAIDESGGALVNSYRVGATRGPVFKVKSLLENNMLFTFLSTHKKEICKVAEATSHHLRLLRYDTKSTGLYRFIRFDFDTQDAMGLNMVTIATDAIVRYIEHETGFQCVSLSGNFCVDKKASWQNFSKSRGIEVWAEIVIPRSVVSTILKTTPQAFVQTWMSKCMIGSAMSGSIGFNSHHANMLAALFIATGQDPAHIAECSIGMTTAEITSNDLYVSVYLPDLMVGTVGGGTSLETQKEALLLLGVSGGNSGKNSLQFAEIVGCTVLAGEISLLSSLSEGTLAKAHNRLARGRM
jgi:hydroxymethylglutaryl-CoA reductase (NADPH)